MWWFREQNQSRKSLLRVKMSARRVVVTGIGMASPLGTSLATSWAGLQTLQSGIQRLQRKGETYGEAVWDALPSQIAGIVPDHEDLRERTDRSRFISLAMLAAREAMEHSRLEEVVGLDRNECGVAIGTGIGSLNDIVNGSQTLNGRGLKRLSPHFVPNVLCNLAAGELS